MVGSEKLAHTAFLEKSIVHLESRGFQSIKADLEGFEHPKSYLKKGTDSKITPDIVAIKNGRKYIFDISLKSEKRQLLKSKWLLLDTLSRMNSDRFKIITTKGHYKFTTTLMEDLNINNEHLIKV
jgi:hypothetical protein